MKTTQEIQAIRTEEYETYEKSLGEALATIKFIERSILLAVVQVAVVKFMARGAGKCRSFISSFEKLKAAKAERALTGKVDMQRSTIDNVVEVISKKLSVYKIIDRIGA